MIRELQRVFENICIFIYLFTSLKLGKSKLTLKVRIYFNFLFFAMKFVMNKKIHKSQTTWFYMEFHYTFLCKIMSLQLFWWIFFNDQSENSLLNVNINKHRKVEIRGYYICYTHNNKKYSPPTDWLKFLTPLLHINLLSWKFIFFIKHTTI